VNKIQNISVFCSFVFPNDITSKLTDIHISDVTASNWKVYIRAVHVCLMRQHGRVDTVTDWEAGEMAFVSRGAEVFLLTAISGPVEGLISLPQWVLDALP
jgi:hypothetical protein